MGEKAIRSVQVFGRQAVEKRGCPRVMDHVFAFLWKDEKSGITECVTNDIGIGGICFDTCTRLTPGCEAWIEIYAPCDYGKRHLESVIARGKVIWLTELEGEKGSNRYRVGMSFVLIEDRDRARIGRYVENGFIDRR